MFTYIASIIIIASHATPADRTSAYLVSAVTRFIQVHVFQNFSDDLKWNEINNGTRTTITILKNPIALSVTQTAFNVI